MKDVKLFFKRLAEEILMDMLTHDDKEVRIATKNIIRMFRGVK